MGDSSKRGRPQSAPRGTTPRQFRLSDDTLAEMDYLQQRFALRSRADVIRFLIRRAALEEKRKDGAK